MNVRELILALQTYDPELPVELKAYCCTHTHPIKVEALYAFEKVEGQPPVVATVVISDEDIRWYDDQDEKDVTQRST